MSEKNLNERQIDIHDIALGIVIGANRWQDARKNGYKDMIEIQKDFNYWQTTLNNPTKDPKEALNAIYETLSHTNHFLVSGRDREALNNIEKVMEDVKEQAPTLVHYEIARKQIDRLKRKTPERLSESNLALIYSNDIMKTVVLEIPKDDN